MRRNQKILVTLLWAVGVLAMIGVVAAGLWPRPKPMPTLYDGPTFSLIDQNGKIVTDANLRGNVWVAAVFFTQCPGVCPMITSRMTDLQKAVPLSDVKLVSFSIDPEHDSPPAMKKYAENFQCDQSRWHFLTSAEQSTFDVARQLHLAAAPAEGAAPITHTQKVLLIDRDNHVRGIYDTSDDASMKKLAEDARNLAAENGSDS